MFSAKEGLSQLFIQNFLSHSTKNFVGEHFGVSKKFWYPKLSCIGGGHHGFFENFLTHRTETTNFVREPFCVSENFWYRKLLCIRGGKGVLRFSVEKFLCHSTEIFRRGTLRFFRKILVSKNFIHKRGMSRFSVEHFLSHSAEEFRREDPFSVSLVSGIENFYA